MVWDILNQFFSRAGFAKRDKISDRELQLRSIEYREVEIVPGEQRSGWEEWRRASQGSCRATQRQPGAGQSFKEASVVDAEGQKADVGPPKADADLSGVM